MTTESLSDGFDDLLGKVERERGLACAGYKQKCLRRRVAVRMRARGVESFGDYSTLLDRDAAEFDKLIGALTVNVTGFFRNWPVWEVMAREVVPELWDSDRADIRAWSAGCA
jgi:chemotaxis protein methyltransferase CheR